MVTERVFCSVRASNPSNTRTILSFCTWNLTDGVSWLTALTVNCILWKCLEDLSILRMFRTSQIHESPSNNRRKKHEAAPPCRPSKLIPTEEDQNYRFAAFCLYVCLHAYHRFARSSGFVSLSECTSIISQTVLTI